MGHAGAFTLPGEPDAVQKINALEAAGVTVVNHPAKFGDAFKTLLKSSDVAVRKVPRSTVSQRRGLHTSRRLRPMLASGFNRTINEQKRGLWIREDFAFNLLRETGITASAYSGKGAQRLLAVAVDRSTLGPCIVASPTVDAEHITAATRKFPFDYRQGFDLSRVPEVADHLQLGGSSKQALPKLICGLTELYTKKEAILLETRVVERLGDLKVTGARFLFDDAAFRSSKRQADIHGLRILEDEDPQEVEAEKDGIVYIKLAGDGNIGTLVNGAGLAMNTVDALADAGGKAANFLDTGGKATSETVKKSFQAILQDDRVKVIFVNIFGGLTLGDMIANGILLAFKELEMKLPVVVRIRGTNEKEGQRIVSDSSLGIVKTSCAGLIGLPDCRERPPAACL